MVAIFVLALFLLFISVDLMVLKFQGKNHPAFEPQFPQHVSPIFERDSFIIPSNLFLSKGHTWLRENSDGLVSVGIDEFGVNALGELSILKCAESGRELKRGEIIFEGTFGNNRVKFLSPVNGIISSVNGNLIGKKISDPYKTWGVKLLSKDFSENREMFFSGKSALDWMKEESSKLKTFINHHLPNVEAAGTTMFDGGSLSNNTISTLVDMSVDEFEKEFLSL
jgi:glycine cleavage system H lipoate-binding protein